MNDRQRQGQPAGGSSGLSRAQQEGDTSDASIDSDHIDSDHVEPVESEGDGEAARAGGGGADSDAVMETEEVRRSSRRAAKPTRHAAGGSRDWTETTMTAGRAAGPTGREQRTRAPTTPGAGKRERASEQKLLDQDYNIHFSHDPFMEIYMQQYGDPPAFAAQYLKMMPTATTTAAGPSSSSGGHAHAGPSTSASTSALPPAQSSTAAAASTPESQPAATQGQGTIEQSHAPAARTP